MKYLQSLALAIAVGAVCAPALASQDSKHQGHHPIQAAAPVAKDAPSTATSSRPNQDMPGMDEEMKAMQDMHEKMMAAKTPEQRKAMMAQHMKVMQSSMKMMSDMPPGGMGAMKCDMGEHHQQMEKRMEMMQSMMQMMMDHMAADPKD